ncbi:hypothetical protein [Kitasatospora sp. NPDC057015]
MATPPGWATGRTGARQRSGTVRLVLLLSRHLPREHQVAGLATVIHYAP